MLSELLIPAFQASVQMHARTVGLEQGRMQLRALEMQLDHQRDIADRQIALARDLIHALIERRIDAIQAGFAAIMSSYAEQARGYMSQQEKLTEGIFKVTDPLERANYNARLSEIDRQLTQIRADSLLLYEEMNSALRLFGGAMPPLRSDDQRDLML